MNGMSGMNSGYKTILEGLYDLSKVLELVSVAIEGFLFPKGPAHPTFTANAKSLRSWASSRYNSLIIPGLQFQIRPAEGTVHRVLGAHCLKPC